MQPRDVTQLPRLMGAGTLAESSTAERRTTCTKLQNQTVHHPVSYRNLFEQSTFFQNTSSLSQCLLKSSSKPLSSTSSSLLAPCSDWQLAASNESSENWVPFFHKHLAWLKVSVAGENPSVSKVFLLPQRGLGEKNKPTHTDFNSLPQRTCSRNHPRQKRSQPLPTPEYLDRCVGSFCKGLKRPFVGVFVFFAVVSRVCAWVIK